MSSSACMLQLTPFNRAHSVTLVHLLQTSGEGGGRVEHYPDADSVSKITQRSIGGRQLLKWSIEGRQLLRGRLGVERYSGLSELVHLFPRSCMVEADFSHANPP